MPVVLKWSPEGKIPRNIPGIFSGQRVKYSIFGGKKLLELSKTCARAGDTTEVSRMQLLCANLSDEQIDRRLKEILYQKKKGI